MARNISNDPKASITTTTAALDRRFSHFGAPKTIITESGAQFNSAKFKQFCNGMGTNYLFSSVYHPQSNRWAGKAIRGDIQALSSKVTVGGKLHIHFRDSHGLIARYLTYLH